MGLLVNKLILSHFRSYERYELELAPELTVIHGANAAGKTNLVEAIQLVTEAASFRNPQWSDLIRWGADEATVSMHASADSRERDVALTIRDSRRFYSVNGKAVRSASAVSGVIPAVVFTPNDLRLIKDSSERRREEIDSLGLQLSSSYRRLRSEYHRSVTQRNRLLREGSFSAGTLDAWSDRVADLGAALTNSRLRLLGRLDPHLKKAFTEIDESAVIEVSYAFGWGLPGQDDPIEFLRRTKDEQKLILKEAMVQKGEQERARGTTLVGPHRDDIRFKIDGRDTRSFGSQGQQRSVALAWKLAEVETVREVTGDSPVLLLDDVMSELDDRRRAALAAIVGTVAQTVVTTANIGYFTEDMLQRAHIVQVGE